MFFFQHSQFILFPSCLHLQSQSSNFNSHYTQSRLLSGQRECGESLLLLLLCIFYTATRTILLKANQIMLFSGVKNFQWHSVMFGIQSQMLSMPTKLQINGSSLIVSLISGSTQLQLCFSYIHLLQFFTCNKLFLTLGSSHLFSFLLFPQFLPQYTPPYFQLQLEEPSLTTHCSFHLSTSFFTLILHYFSLIKSVPICELVSSLISLSSPPFPNQNVNSK